jgi:hypothetical protein
MLTHFRIYTFGGQ